MAKLLWVVGVFGLWWLFKLLFDNILYAGFVGWLKREFGFEEAALSAAVTANLVPILAAMAVMYLIFRLSKDHHAGPLDADRQRLVNQAFAVLDPLAITWLRSSHVSGRPKNSTIGVALLEAGLIDRDFVGFTEVKPDLKPLVAKKLKTIDARWRHAAIKLKANVDPYLVPIGIAIIIIGAAVVGYGAYRQHAISKNLRAEMDTISTILAEAQKSKTPAAVSRETMLSGRPVSGREVVQRLEQLESELDGTKKELAKANLKLEQTPTDLNATHPQSGPVSAKPTTPMKRMLTAYDVEQRQKAIDEIYKFLDEKMMATSAAGEILSRDIQKKIDSGTAVAGLDQYAETATKTIADYFEFCAKYMYLHDIYTIAISTDGWNPADAPKKASLLRAELQELQQRHTTIVPDFLRNNKLLADFKSDHSGKFWTWINEKRNALSNKRIEYGNAEIYPR